MDSAAAIPADAWAADFCRSWRSENGIQAKDAALSVLLVEDEALISLDLCDTLVEAGYRVMGPAMTVAGAMFLLQQDTPHLAIIDVLLRDGVCTKLANRLREHGVPFFIHSGYGRHAEEISGFSGERWLAKPALPGEIISMLGELLQQGSALHAGPGKREPAK